MQNPPQKSQSTKHFRPKHRERERHANNQVENWAAMAYFTARRNLASLLTRTLSSSSSSSLSSRSRFALTTLLNPQLQFAPAWSKTNQTRPKTSGSGYSPLNDPSPNWSNRPPKETILLDGCDYEHWLIVMEFPTDPKPSEDEMVNSYIKTLSTVLGRYCFLFLFLGHIFIFVLDFWFIYFCGL